MNSQTESNQGLSDRARQLALYVLCAGVLMIVLDVTVVNVALPSIQSDLGFSNASLAWVVNAYLISFGGALLLGGRLGDLIGRRNIFFVGLGLFTAASFLCGVSQSQEMLVIARFLQGVGGALTSAVVLGMIVAMFPSPQEQAKAIGVYAFVASAGGAVGLLAGGVLTQALNWHWIFFVNVPIGIATAVLAKRLIPNDQGIGYNEGADIVGATLITSSLMLAVYTMVKPAAEKGWTDGETLGLGAIAVALLVAFVARQATADKPLMSLSIFKSRNLTGANLIQVFSVAGMFGMFFMGSLYMQRVLGYDALKIGLAFLPVTLIMGTLSVRYSAPLIMRFGPRNVVFVGLLCVAGALLLLTRLPVDGNYITDLFPAMLLMGLGGGSAFPALMGLAMSGVDPTEAGLASGLVNTTAQVGGALGLALLATLSNSRHTNLLAQGHNELSASTGGYHLAFWIAAGLVGTAVVVVLAVIRPPAMPSAEHAPAESHNQEPAFSS